MLSENKKVLHCDKWLFLNLMDENNIHQEQPYRKKYKKAVKRPYPYSVIFLANSVHATDEFAEKTR